MRVGHYARLYLIAGLAVVVVLVCWPSTVFFYEKWSDTASKTYTHGWLILLICVGLVVRARSELSSAPVRPSALASVALALAIILSLVTSRASIEGLEAPLQPLIFWLAVTAAFGWAVGRLLLFPVGYFYFAVPVWYGTPLKNLTVLVTRGLLAITGPAASSVGDVIRLPNGTFVIEEGCSGLHFMIVGLAVAALYGEQRHDLWRVRLRQLALMAGLALLANWVRVYTIIEAGYLTDMQSYLVRVSHYGFGWCVFAVALLAFFWVAPLLGPEPPQPQPVAALPRAGAMQWHTELGGVAAALTILIALPLLNVALRAACAAPPLPHAAASLNPEPPWHAVPLDVRSAWLPVFPGADELQRRAFGNSSGDTVEAFGVAYRTQRQGAELVGEASSLLGDRLQAYTEQVVVSKAGAFREAEVADDMGARSLIWWRYQIGDRNLVGPFTQQLWYGINALVCQPSAGLLALRTPCNGECRSARRTLEEFVAHGGIR
jgi:exosortase